MYFKRSFYLMSFLFLSLSFIVFYYTKRLFSFFFSFFFLFLVWVRHPFDFIWIPFEPQSLGPKQRQPNLHFVLKLFNLCQSPSCRYLVVLKGYHVAFLMTSLPTIATCFLFLSFSACFAPNSSPHRHHFSYFLPMHA